MKLEGGGRRACGGDGGVVPPGTVGARPEAVATKVVFVNRVRVEAYRC